VAVKGTGKFSIHRLADNRANTVESLLLNWVTVFFLVTKRNVVSFRVLNGHVSCLGTKYVKSLWIRLDTIPNKHWPGRNPTKRRCRVCSERGVTRTVRSKCVKYDVALCMDRACFTDYHPKDTL